MKRFILILALALNTSNCGKSTTEKTTVNKSISSRSVASTENGTTLPNESSNQKISNPSESYPSSFISFLKNEQQNVKPQQTLKQYANIIPEATFSQMLKMVNKVDDAGFKIKRNKDNLILDNGKSKLIVLFSKSSNTILATIQGQTYDFNNQQVVLSYLTNLENKIDQDLKNQKKSSQSSGSSLIEQSLDSKKLISVFSYKKLYANSDQILNGLAQSFFQQCKLLNLPLLSQNSEALATGWFILGGMALIAVAIAMAANKMTKNLSKTEHKVTVDHQMNHNVKLDGSTQGALDQLSGAALKLDPNEILNNIKTNNATTTNSLGIE